MNIEIYNKILLENKPDIDELMAAARQAPDDPEFRELRDELRSRGKLKNEESLLSDVYQLIARSNYNADGSVDIDEDVDMRFIKLSAISDMAIFGIVKGFFDCYSCGLVSLEGAPRECVEFDCSNNNLTSLKYAPKKCKKFNCSQNHLRNLIGSPECEQFNCMGNHLDSLEGALDKYSRFTCSQCFLTSLEHAPKECEVFSCEYNFLTSLVGGPDIVLKSYFCRDNRLTSLVGSPKKCKEFHCQDNQLTTLEGGPEVFDVIYCGNNPVSSADLLYAHRVELGRKAESEKYS